MEARLQARLQAHAAGPCAVAWTRGDGGEGSPGWAALTAGADCTLRAHAPGGGGGAEGGKGRRAAGDLHKDAVTCLAVLPGGRAVATGSEDKSVKLSILPELEFENMATRFSLPVRALAAAPPGAGEALLACGGDDEGVKVVRVEDGKKPKVRKTLSTEGRSVKALAWDPDGKYLAAATPCGSLQVWDVEEGLLESCLERAFPKVDPDAAVARKVCWYPDGSSLVAPGTDNNAVVYERMSWSVEAELAGEHSEPVAAVALSRNGLYALTSGEDRKLVLWDFHKRKVLQTRVTEAVIVDIAWHPEENTVAAVDTDGQLLEWRDVVPDDLPDPNTTIDDVVTAPLPTEGGEGDEEGGEGAEGGVGLARGGAAVGGAAGPEGAAALATLTALQGPFQPGATPLQPGDEGRGHFLAFTMDGFISTSEEGDFSNVQVAFHDVNRTCRVPSFRDLHGFTLGALGGTGAFFASEQHGDDIPALLQFQSFDPQYSDGEWQYTLPLGEEPRALAAGLTFVACATSRGNLRLFSPMGVQIGVLRLQAPVVTLAARGGRLACLTHRGLPLVSAPGAAPQLEVSVYDVDNFSLVLRSPAPLPSGVARAEWLGFSEEGHVALAHSDGVVSVLTEDFGGSWTPVHEPAAGEEDQHVWVVGLSEQSLYFTVTKEGELPAVHPKPVLRTKRLRVPVLEGEEETLQEDRLRTALFWRHGVRSGSAREDNVGLDNLTLKLMFKLMRKPETARDLFRMLTTQNGRSLSVRVANRGGQLALAEEFKAVVESGADLGLGGPPIGGGGGGERCSGRGRAVAAAGAVGAGRERLGRRWRRGVAGYQPLRPWSRLCLQVCRRGALGAGQALHDRPVRGRLMLTRRNSIFGQSK